ncbi:MAG: undecaprenyldiphospho-muramoylpentapeptide beta-N-acetylglucosaminyltransferase [Candidatus Cloacimonadota bacterium]|nr:undecaprenyldiphospho-muramoylpentapeptide beta-N-acetylglucosaminyltransferase [Candidatus Cloacimonadota bacterium]
MKIVISGGGSGGHIAPAISIANHLSKLGYEIIYIGNKSSMESEYAQKNNLNFKAIEVQKLYRYFTFKHVFFPFKLIYSIIKSYQIIKKSKADFFIGTGGFVTGPVGLAAQFAKIPIFLQEQNSFPGLTTRKLAKYAQLIFLGNKGAKKYLPDAKTIFSGNPISSQIKTNEKLDLSDFRLNPDWKTVLILGGSQGSSFINKLIFNNIKNFSKMNLNIIWQIGKREIDKYEKKLKKQKNIYYFDFTFQLPKFYNICDFGIARAGAISLAELEELKIPSIIIPLPSAAGNHQVINAKEFQERGLGICIEQNKIEFFMQNLQYMINNEDEFKINSKKSKHSGALQLIVKHILIKVGEVN